MGWLSSIAIAQNPNSNPNAQAPWKLNGNQADTTQFVGTTNNIDLVFKRNNIEGLRLLEDTSTRFMGNVFLDKLKPITPLPPTEIRLVTADNNGKLTSLDKSGLLSAIYDEQLPCFLLPNNQLPTPIWSAIPGVLYTGVGCPASVGIGTDTPVAALDVRGAGFFQGLGVNTTPTINEMIKINNTTNRTGIEITNNHPTAFALKYGIKNIVNNPNTIAYAVTDQITNQDVFVVMGDGKTGIGTANPEDDLQIRSGSTKLVVGSSGGHDLVYGTSYIGFNASRQNGSTWQTSDDTQHNGGSVIYGDIFGSIIFSTIPTEPSPASGGQTNIPDATIKTNTRLFIHKDGNVGIGTTAVNGAKLSVEGVIRARRLIVNATPWADYVFESTYNLMPISQLEEYIITNKHLPNMPTAEVVEKEGADLGEINRVLVEKVEELTLYIIALNKRMEQLEVDNKVLKGERQ
ncbi:MAG: hypothetical protein CVT95_09985 [Bacteroidetes bacterium HGW-Bacteroidetes-12]|nr:MAG: hypothetical protein CVT95_09985 [Bacteroidetes bacterium HGW-Bacteroidetes-12]